MHQGYGMRAWIGDGDFRGFRWTKNNSFLSIWQKPNGEDVKGQVGESAKPARDRKCQREVPRPS